MEHIEAKDKQTRKIEERIGFYFAGLIGFGLYAYISGHPSIALFSVFFFLKASRALKEYEEIREALRKSDSGEKS